MGRGGLVEDVVVLGDAQEQEQAAWLRSAVEMFQPIEEGGEESKTRFLALLDEIALPVSREADPRHVTASAVVISPLGVLLHLHKRAALWTGPGGHVDEGEWPAESAVRETLEETGLEVRHPDAGPVVVHIDVHEAGAHVHYDLRFLALADAVQPRPPEGESQDVEWLSLEVAKGRADRSYQHAIEAAERYLAAQLGQLPLQGQKVANDPSEVS
jgi:ADP-ribose pyrophosphatase YjhB (NUDIX family)